MENTQLSKEQRYETIVRNPDDEEYRVPAREIKEDAIERLSFLIEQTKRSIKANEGTVYIEDHLDGFYKGGAPVVRTLINSARFGPENDVLRVVYYAITGTRDQWTAPSQVVQPS